LRKINEPIKAYQDISG